MCLKLFCNPALQITRTRNVATFFRQELLHFFFKERRIKKMAYRRRRRGRMFRRRLYRGRRARTRSIRRRRAYGRGGIMFA